MSDSVILCSLDGSPLAEAAIPYAVVLAKAVDAKIRLVIVWENLEEVLVANQPETAARIALAGREACQRYADEHVAKLAARNIQADALVLEGKPAAEILKLAEGTGTTCVVISSHGRSGIGRWWSGSVASGIVRHSTSPVLVVGPEVLEAAKPPQSFGRLLVPLDGSDASLRALALAADLASKTGGTIVLAQVLQWSTQASVFGEPDMEVGRLQEDLARASADYLSQTKAGLSVPAETHVLHGIPADELLRLVEAERIDLVVMGTRGRGGLMRMALGSVAERMIHAKAPVLLVRQADS